MNKVQHNFNEVRYIDIIKIQKNLMYKLRQITTIIKLNTNGTQKFKIFDKLVVKNAHTYVCFRGYVDMWNNQYLKRKA